MALLWLFLHSAKHIIIFLSPSPSPSFLDFSFPSSPSHPFSHYLPFFSFTFHFHFTPLLPPASPIVILPSSPYHPPPPSLPLSLHSSSVSLAPAVSLLFLPLHPAPSTSLVPSSWFPYVRSLSQLLSLYQASP